MKIVEEIKVDQTDLSINIIFTIIGDRPHDSLMVPMWQQSFIITRDQEINIQNRTEFFERMKIRNAIGVFEKYYQEIFNKK